MLRLPAGRYTVKVEVPRAYESRRLPNGDTQVRTFTLKGEEHIDVLGADSKQSLVFNSDNLERREVEDDDGH